MLAAVLPTLVLPPAKLSRSSSRSGHELPLAVRVQNEKVSPLVKVRTGVNIQLLMVPVPAVLLKFAAM